MTGYVHDSSDAAIVGAKVIIQQLATFEGRETVTNERGEFTAPYLRRGEYSVTVTIGGFKGQTFTGIVLAVDQTVKLPVVLQPGVVEQSIEVTGAAPLVDASTSSFWPSDRQQEGSWPKSAIGVEGFSIQQVGGVTAGVNPRFI